MPQEKNDTLNNIKMYNFVPVKWKWKWSRSVVSDSATRGL